MRIVAGLVDRFIDLVVAIVCRLHVSDLEKVPMSGPLILVTNHVNNLEILVLRSRLRDRRVVALAKAESWKNPVLRWLLNGWEAIPVRRGETDIAALRSALSVLKHGRILGLAPEGTRSRHGRLQRGHPGVVTIALKSGAPLVPVVFHGGESVRRNLHRLRRTPFYVRVGEPFKIRRLRGPLTTETRQRIADEIMGRLASLLPSDYRGVYANSGAQDEYLEALSSG